MCVGWGGFPEQARHPGLQRREILGLRQPQSAELGPSCRKKRGGRTRPPTFSPQRWILLVLRSPLKGSPDTPSLWIRTQASC